MNWSHCRVAHTVCKASRSHEDLTCHSSSVLFIWMNVDAVDFIYPVVIVTTSD